VVLEQHVVGGEDYVAHDEEYVDVEQDHVSHDVQVDDLLGVGVEDVKHGVQGDE